MRARRMTGAPHLERRCSRLARVLEASPGDEITLLRAARALKGVHCQLAEAVRDAAGGWTYYDRAVAQRALSSMERDLRHVLLNHQTLRDQQVRSCLLHAVQQSFQVLDVMQALDLLAC
ncbi:MAG: hypothetical protein JOZ41_18950 [Chloroflexi bacterium]|nr:hypothetical protein [Chloroflexota bacterium]